MSNPAIDYHKKDATHSRARSARDDDDVLKDVARALRLLSNKTENSSDVELLDTRDERERKRGV